MLSRRMFLLTDLGRNTLQIYFLHRPIRDLLEYAGFYARLDPYNRLHVLFLTAFSAALAIFLGTGYISAAFRKLRTVFDPLLEKHHAL
jgi:fucose 4-O-acetylase-like acetyltransferase